MLPKIQSLIAPLATPFAPALLLGNEVFQVMILVGIPWWLALVCSILAIGGLESTGALSCYMAVKAWRYQNYKAMWLAILGAIAYALIVFFGIRFLPEQRAQVFSVFVFVTLVAYLVYALFYSFVEQEKAQASGVDKEIELTKQRKQLVNAESRKMQWEAQTQNERSRSFAPNSTNEQERGIDELSKQLDVWAYLDANGLRGPSEVANALGIAKSTAHKHIKSWQEKSVNV